MYRILVVDDDATCLIVAKACLKRWNYYEVRTVSHPLQVLNILDEEEEKPYDLVLADVHMPDMNGFELLKHVNAKFNIPVVLISADDKVDVICRGLLDGAPAYLLKPITADTVKHIWQYSELWKNKERDTYRRISQASVPRSISSSLSSNRDTEDKPRDKKAKEPVWTPNLHNRFVEAMLILGPHDAVPRNILEMMNVQSLTREQVASHLQKFRKFLTSVLDGKTTLNEASNSWIDRHYHSRIVGGNPNQILLDQLFEKRRTEKSADPIRAFMPLPPFNEAKSSSSRRKNTALMLMPNTYASSSANAAGLGGFTLESSVNADMPTLGQGVINLQSDENVSMPTAKHGSVPYFQGASSLKNLGNIVGSSSANNNFIQNVNYEANQIGYYNQNTMVPYQHYSLANTDPRIRNMQLHHDSSIHSSFGANQFEITSGTNEQLVNAGHGPNFASSSDGNQFGHTFGANQQLANFQVDPNIGNTVGGTNEFGNASNMVQFHGGAEIGDLGLFINNRSEVDNIPADYTLLGFDQNLINQGDSMRMWGAQGTLRNDVGSSKNFEK